MKLFLAAFLAGIVFIPRAEAQRIIIDGYVINSETGKHLKEVNIFDKNSGIGTISDNSGYFHLMLDAGKVILSFSEENFSDYISEFTAKNDTVLNITLKLEKELKKDSIDSDNERMLSSAGGIKKFVRK